MKFTRKTLIFFIFIMILSMLLPGCTENNDANSDKDMKIYDCQGLKIAIPNENIDKLIIDSSYKEEENYQLLLNVHEKRSFEEAEKAGQNDNGGYTYGYLFSIIRYTRVQYEKLFDRVKIGLTLFAKDENYYYGMGHPTDVRFFGTEEQNLPESDEWKAWEVLQPLGKTVTDDIIIRNNLTKYDDEDFMNNQYTYDSEHIFVTLNGVYTFTLSQPAKKGEGGIWCVERYKDSFNNIMCYFPNTGKIAIEYYTELQAECDNGQNLFMLDPLEVAKEFVANSDKFSPEDASGEFLIIEK